MAKKKRVKELIELGVGVQPTAISRIVLIASSSSLPYAMIVDIFEGFPQTFEVN